MIAKDVRLKFDFNYNSIVIYWIIKHDCVFLMIEENCYTRQGSESVYKFYNLELKIAMDDY